MRDVANTPTFGVVQRLTRYHEGVSLAACERVVDDRLNGTPMLNSAAVIRVEIGIGLTTITAMINAPRFATQCQGDGKHVLGNGIA